MARLRARSAVLEAVIMRMLEVGKPMSKHEWDKDENAPVRTSKILTFFGSWSRLLNLIEHNSPEVWADLNKKATPPPQEKPKPVSDPLEALSKSTPKVDIEEEKKEDGQDI